MLLGLLLCTRETGPGTERYELNFPLPFCSPSQKTWVLGLLLCTRGTGFPSPVYCVFVRRTSYCVHILTGIPSKPPFFSEKPRRNRRSRRGKKTGDGISVPRFPRFSQNGPLTMYTSDTTVQYGTAVNQVQYNTAHHAEQQKYIYCTVQYCIWWMLHCKKSPSPVTHSKTHVFCEGEETGNGKFYSYRSGDRSHPPCT